MTSRKINKIIAVLLSALLLAAPVYPAALTGKALSDDIAYYRKVAREKKLDSNGRYYILQRIEDKYRNSSVNLAPLKQELNKLKRKDAPVEKKKATRKTTTRPSAAGTVKKNARNGTLKKITIIDTDTVTRITIFSPGTERSNYFLLKDPEPGQFTKLVLDLYDTVNVLEGNERSIDAKEGIFAGIRVGQFKDPPDPIVRVVAELRQVRPYRIIRDQDTWTIVAEKESKELNGQSAIPPAAAITEQPADAQKMEAFSMPVAAAAPVQPATIVPAAKAAITDAADTDSGIGYLIETGDVLGITIFPADELSREVVVQSDGNVPFPLIGRAKAKGLTAKQLESEMAKSLGRYIAHPTVTIAVKLFSKRQLFVTGEVRSVGTFTYKNKTRLLEFISSLGGFTESANRKEIKVYRGTADKRQTFTVDLEEVIRSGNFANDFPLEPGDIVEVPQGRARIAVLGDVRNPGYYDYRDNLHLVELVSLAGGFTDTAELKKVRILHPSDVNRQQAESVNLKEILSGRIKDVPVQNGDTVYVPKGNMANANWFISNILPWVSLVSLVLVIRSGI